MTSVLHSTRPYGRYLQSYLTDEVVTCGDRFLVFHVRYREDGGVRTEIERHVDVDNPHGHSDLSAAIQSAEDSRKDFVACEAEEMAAAAEEVRAREYAYETQPPYFPDDSEAFDPLQDAVVEVVPMLGPGGG